MAENVAGLGSGNELGALRHLVKGGWFQPPYGEVNSWFYGPVMFDNSKNNNPTAYENRPVSASYLAVITY